jgi:hypothetical protein
MNARSAGAEGTVPRAEPEPSRIGRWLVLIIALSPRSRGRSQAPVLEERELVEERFLEGPSQRHP